MDREKLASPAVTAVKIRYHAPQDARFLKVPRFETTFLGVILAEMAVTGVVEKSTAAMRVTASPETPAALAPRN